MPPSDKFFFTNRARSIGIKQQQCTFEFVHRETSAQTRARRGSEGGEGILARRGDVSGDCDWDMIGMSGGKIMFRVNTKNTTNKNKKKITLRLHKKATKGRYYRLDIRWVTWCIELQVHHCPMNRFCRYRVV